MQTVKLPINPQPPIIVYQYRAFPLSITSNYPETLTWFYSNFIHLKCNLNFIKNKDDFDIDFIAGDIYGGIPWLDYLESDLALKINTEEQHDLRMEIISKINEGYYFYSFVDEYYIPHRQAYKKFHNTHDLLITGYDLLNNRFHIIGFNERMQYAESDVSFEDFMKALKFSEAGYSSYLKMKENVDYSFDKAKVIDKLEDYLFSNNCAGKLSAYDFDDRTEHMKNLNHNLSSQNWGYGVDVYTQLNLFFDALIANEIRFDIRPLHCLWEHKKCMFDRIHFFFQRHMIHDSEIVNSYQKVVAQADVIRSLTMKYMLTNEISILNRIKSIIDELRINEINILNDVVRQLHND
ncbi:hypothetical protein R70723_28615 [Paenibacillus sp. FSL R7-0273]|uniref:hypothetical protein n=1 Tax=Paenibacillus sp. FSL R7-0273 TaxID=1536772 RepID=UPI0004F86361|nr:hypothetical protein [Paenibacillus sp. FSL R7-0273]AIQ49403.1 hypothetical protein R70723_28615 [Paenibacillus sp. FSL R7-0273]OMF83969.1 hypothetical protein BK144_31030 [Paenibacillus sp. FSL R7-0273]